MFFDFCEFILDVCVQVDEHAQQDGSRVVLSDFL